MHACVALVEPELFTSESVTAIRSPIDIVAARQRGRAAALALGFGGADITLVAAAISEVARNIVEHAKEGEIAIQILDRHGRHGVQIVASDHGPGICDVALAMQYGYSTRRGIGMGLPGAKWLMDEFNLASTVGRGTTVTMVKWLPDEADHSHAA